MFKLTPKEQKLIIILGFLLVISVILRFTLPEYESVSEPGDTDGYTNVSFENNPPTGEGQEDIPPEKKIAKELIVVHVVGEVVNPGIYTLEEGSRVYEALEKAGGCLEDAALEMINLAQPLLDGQQVYIPVILEEGSHISGSPGSLQGESFSNTEKVNINTADISQLETLPGIGEVKAQNIISYREQNGLFQSVEDLTNVSGIGDKTLEGIKDLITVY